MSIAPKVILYVEDDENEAILLGHALAVEPANYDLRHVSEPKELMDYLFGVGKFTDRARYPVPSVVLLDVKMPGLLDGFDLLAWLQEQPTLKHIPVVMLTSSDAPEDKSRALKKGARAFVTKRLNWVTVITALEQVCSSPDC